MAVVPYDLSCSASPGGLVLPVGTGGPRHVSDSDSGSPGDGLGGRGKVGGSRRSVGGVSPSTDPSYSKHHVTVNISTTCKAIFGNSKKDNN